MKHVVILSGGMDSATLLFHVREMNPLNHVVALSIKYGQRHEREIGYAQRIAFAARVNHHVIDLTTLRSVLSRGALTGGVAVPEGHYADESMKQTVVPNRNMILLSIAAGFAIARGFDSIAYGAHAGDHAIYPDCRPEFVERMRYALEVADFAPVGIYAPFVEMTKADIVKLGHGLKVPYEDTYSCYKGGASHCGRCGTCVERREAFKLAGVSDPTIYE